MTEGNEKLGDLDDNGDELRYDAVLNEEKKLSKGISKKNRIIIGASFFIIAGIIGYLVFIAVKPRGGNTAKKPDIKSVKLVGSLENPAQETSGGLKRTALQKAGAAVYTKVPKNNENMANKAFKPVFKNKNTAAASAVKPVKPPEYVNATEAAAPENKNKDGILKNNLGNLAGYNEEIYKLKRMIKIAELRNKVNSLAAGNERVPSIPTGTAGGSNNGFNALPGFNAGSSAQPELEAFSNNTAIINFGKSAVIFKVGSVYEGYKCLFIGGGSVTLIKNGKVIHLYPSM